MRLPIAILTGVVAAAPAFAQPISGHGRPGGTSSGITTQGAATGNDIVVYDGNTGTIVQDGGLPVSAFCQVANGCTYASSVGFADGGVWNSGGIAAHGSVSAVGPINTTSTLGMELNGTIAVVPIAIANGPTASPDAGSSYGPGSLYIPEPIVVTQAETLAAATPTTSQSQINGYLTIPTGISVTNAQYLVEDAVSVSGAGTLVAGVTTRKNYIIINSGVVSTNVTNELDGLSNSGSISNYKMINAGFVNNSAGTISGSLIGMHLRLQNNNATAGAVADYQAIECDPVLGTAPTFDECMHNGDASAEIDSAGHWGWRSSGSLTLSPTSCGTLTANSGDSLGAIIIPSGTACAVEFAVHFISVAPVCQVSAPGGGSPFTWTTSTTQIAITNTGTGSAVADWQCAGLF